MVELKKGRASDVVVGQIQRYMGFVNADLAEAHQTVKGVIIALDDDLRLRRALSVTQNIEFYRYQVSFKERSGNSHPLQWIGSVTFILFSPVRFTQRDKLNGCFRHQVYYINQSHNKSENGQSSRG